MPKPEELLTMRAKRSWSFSERSNTRPRLAPIQCCPGQSGPVPWGVSFSRKLRLRCVRRRGASGSLSTISGQSAATGSNDLRGIPGELEQSFGVEGLHTPAQGRSRMRRLLVASANLAESFKFRVFSHPFAAETKSRNPVKRMHNDAARAARFRRSGSAATGYGAAPAEPGLSAWQRSRSSGSSSRWRATER